MLRPLLLIAPVILLSADFATADDDKAAGKGPLEGAWKLASVQLGGQALPMEKLHEARLVVRGPKYSFTLGDTRLEMTHELLTDQRPGAMNLKIAEGQDKGKVYHAIYKLEGDRLTVCRSIHPDQERPTQFASKTDSELLLVVWTRDETK
jgi:uncharacterized protein (TIGR03067 family)